MLMKGSEQDMKKQYEAFLAEPKSIPEGEPIRFFIRDLTPGPRKYDARFVKAIVSSSPEKLSGSDTLQLRSLGGKIYPKVLSIKIIEDLGECVSGIPYAVHNGLFPENDYA
jgi:hypothetical protein